jgi:hypothetical protein
MLSGIVGRFGTETHGGTDMESERYGWFSLQLFLLAWSQLDSLLQQASLWLGMEALFD